MIDKDRIISDIKDITRGHEQKAQKALKSGGGTETVCHAAKAEALKDLLKKINSAKYETYTAEQILDALDNLFIHYTLSNNVESHDNCVSGFKLDLIKQLKAGIQDE